MDQSESSNLNGTLLFVMWLVSLLIVGVVSYFFGKGSVPQENNLTSVITTPAPTSAISPNSITPTASVDLESICEITGPSQKKDYLDTYLLKEGDSFNSIAEKELGDATRVSELTKLNEDQRQLTVGSTIYLPPKEITQSSGNLAQVSGRLVKKDNASWQLTYGGGTAGPGIIFPGFWFKDFTEADMFHVGDCVTIFFDNGVKIYSVRKN